MRIPSGKTDQLIYFVAVDSTDLKTRETGLTSFTVYRSRNGGTATIYTTPTVAELSAANMPGVYSLVIDEDTTIASTSDSEEYCVHITQASMAPVTRTIELYRYPVTSGTSITVANGAADADLERIQGTVISTPATAGILDVNVKNIDNDAASASGVVTFPAATLASTTNITAGTITTATNVTTVNGLAANVITAAATATDFGTEVANAVWDTDATAHQTQGSFGQVLGDSGADTDTIWSLANTNLDAAVSSRMATYTQPTGFLAATFPSGTIANTTNITAGTITTATNVTTVNGLAADVITATAIATNAIDADAISSDAVTEIRSVVSGTADSGSTTTMVDAARTEADTDYWKDMAILFTSGTISGQARLITAFNPATDTITFSPATTQAVLTNTYEIIPNVAAAGASAPTAAEVADAVWDEDATAHQTQGSFGQVIGDSVADTDSIWSLSNTNLDAAVSSRSSQTSVDIIDDFLDTEIAAIKAKTDQLTFTTVNRVDSQVFGIEANSITAAAIATGAVDADALATDGVNEIRDAVWAKTLSELGAIPSATPAASDALMLQFMALRNLRETTATADRIKNDVGTTIATATLSDDGTTFTKTEYV